MLQKRMFKVVCPIEKKDGGSTYWMRIGTAFTNKDDSINIYLDAYPAPPHQAKLQLRELDEAELRANAERRASYAPRAPAAGAAEPIQDLPF